MRSRLLPIEAVTQVAGFGKIFVLLIILKDFRHLSLLCNHILNFCDAHQRVSVLGHSVFNHVSRVHLSTGEAKL